MNKITFNKINKIANDVLREAYGQSTEADIRNQMLKLIESQKEKIILDALGLEKSHWNGEISVERNGSFRSNLKNLSEEYLLPIGKNILHDLFENTKIELSESQKNALRKAYKEAYLDTASDMIRLLAEEQAKIDAPTLFEDFMKQQE
jgi:choline kinase